nr:hypothetical protein [Desulfobacula sp.]
MKPKGTKFGAGGNPFQTAEDIAKINQAMIERGEKERQQDIDHRATVPPFRAYKSKAEMEAEGI